MLVHHYLDYYARNTPDLPCLTQGEVTSSYGEVASQSNRLANGLLKLGITQGQRLAILGENSLEHLLLFMAASKIGAVTVPLNYRLAPAELAFIIGDAGARVVVALDGMAETLHELRQLIDSDITVLSHDFQDTLHWNDWISEFADKPPVVEVASDDAYIQLYTSGTTGNPKGVVTSHFNMLSMFSMTSTAIPAPPSPGMATILCAPLFHIGGAGSFAFNTTVGMHTLLHRVFDPAKVVSDMEDYPVNNIFMVPAMIMAVLQLADVEKRDFGKLKQIYYGASPISETLLRRAIEVFDCDFIQLYGMTETTGAGVNLTADDHRKALSGRPELLRACGRASVGVQIKVVDENGKERPRGEIGEIWLKSDSNMVSYFKLPEATAANLTEGWVHTGDAGYMDEEDYVYLKDRVKDMVVSGGENIYPVEVENAIAKHEAVADVAVIGVPNEKFGEALLAFVVLQPDCSLSVEELVEFCRDKIAGYKIPRQMEIIDELPRNPSGKVLKKILRQPYWEGTKRNIG